MGTNEEALQYLNIARTAVNQAIDKLQPSGLVSTPEQLERAIIDAPDNSTIPLATSLRYPRMLSIVRPLVFKGVEVTGTGRVTREEALPMFLAGLRTSSSRAVFSNVDVSNAANPGTDIVGVGGQHVIFDRVRVLGDPLLGAKRGIAANGEDVTVVRCLIDDIGRVGQDTQAVCSWDAGAGLTLMDSYLGAAGQSVMIGGADSSSAERMPSAITIQGCQLTKNPAWYGKGWQIKAALEFKAGREVLVDNCDLEYAGIAQGQPAALIVATPRNQGGAAPWTEIHNVTIQNCRGRFGGAVLATLGTDDTFEKPSGFLDGFTIRDCHFTDIDPLGLTGGRGRIFEFNRGPRNVTLDNIVVEGKNIKAYGYFLSRQAPVNLKLTRLTLPPNPSYTWKLDGNTHPDGVNWPVGTLPALRAYMPDITIDETIR